MRILCLALVQLSGWALAQAAPPDAGLVLHYPFSGDARDQSGNGLDGKLVGDARIVNGALQLDGEDDYLTGGKTPGEGIDLSNGGTMIVWAQPKTRRGGLVAWCVDHTYPGARCMLCIDTYHGGANAIGLIADGKTSQGFRGFHSPPADVWTHLAFTFDGKTVRSYLDGVATARNPQQLTPVIRDVELTVGRALGLGAPYFHGALDEVRIYDRALSAAEIRAVYLHGAAQRGKDVSVFRRPVVKTHAYPAPGRIVVAFDCRAMLPLPAGAVVVAELGDERGHASVAADGEVILDATSLANGAHTVRAYVQNANGRRIGRAVTADLNWPGRDARFEGVRILNNLCWELLDAKSPTGEVTFRLPVDRWVWIRCDAPVRLADNTILPPEAMRRLPAGEHTVRIAGEVNRLTVRAIPALHHAMYGSDPHLQKLGPYDWDFLERNDLLNNFNVMVAGLDHYRRGDAFERLPQWAAMGRQWISYKHLPFDAKSADDVYELWTDTAGFNNPHTAGLIIDEANGGDLEVYDYLTEAVKRMQRQQQFKGKAVSPWCDILYSRDRSTRFAQTCLDAGADLIWECYFGEEESPDMLRTIMRRHMAALMPNWEEVFPGVTYRMVIAMNNCSEPPENVGYRPNVDLKVCMDQQMHFLANHPAMFGIAGTQWYHAGYSTEEIVRWIGKLNRHYAINGGRGRLSKDPYFLPHLRNHDFADGTTDWELRPVDGESMRIDSMPDYGARIQGRFFGGISGRDERVTRYGDTFLIMTRREGGPNVLQQTVTDLEPGRVYSFKMLTADRQDLLSGVSRRDPHAVSIRIDGVEQLPGDKYGFHEMLKSSRPFGAFTWKKRFYIGYHWRVFRAESETATLTVTDWASSDQPGGKAGQELMFSFFEVQPFLSE